MLILCDFDGTITIEDITNMIWDRHGIPNWREVLLPPYRAGKTTAIELMAQGYKAVKQPSAELLELVRPHIKIRPGFPEFVAQCRARSWPLYVVSCGLDWYLRHYLPPEVPFHGLRSELKDGWDVHLPEGCTLAPGQDFKVNVYERLRERHAGLEMAFIGDGRNDFPVARRAQRVFSVRESTLEALCGEHKVPQHPFVSFHEVLAVLQR